MSMHKDLGQECPRDDEGRSLVGDGSTSYQG